MLPPQVLVYVVLFAAIILAMKPVVFYFLLRRHSELRELAWDISYGHPFSYNPRRFSAFIISSYIVVFNFPNPIAISDRLRRD